MFLPRYVKRMAILFKTSPARGQFMSTGDNERMSRLREGSHLSHTREWRSEVIRREEVSDEEVPRKSQLRRSIFRFFFAARSLCSNVSLLAG